MNDALHPSLRLLPSDLDIDLLADDHAEHQNVYADSAAFVALWLALQSNQPSAPLPDFSDQSDDFDDLLVALAASRCEYAP
jgi:hypothetical protein